MSQAPLAALRVFEAVARHGSFSRAADELCVTQSAVSHQVRGLEAWFGAPLFERSGNRATLLPHADALAHALSRSLSDIEAACRQARRAGGPPTLTVAAIPSVAICWLIPRLGRFRGLSPATEVRLVYAFHGHPIDFREVDLAMMRLFGGFGPRVFAAYEEAWPLPDGHRQRVALYQLYPLLVHVNLFGHGYVASLDRALADALEP